MKKITKILLMFVLIISCFAGVVAFAGCKENKIKVNFCSKYGELSFTEKGYTISKDNAEKIYLEKEDLPEITNEGDERIFDKWVYENGTEYSADLPITGNITLYATFTESEFVWVESWKQYDSVASWNEGTISYFAGTSNFSIVSSYKPTYKKIKKSDCLDEYITKSEYEDWDNNVSKSCFITESEEKKIVCESDITTNTYLYYVGIVMGNKSYCYNKHGRQLYGYLPKGYDLRNLKSTDLGYFALNARYLFKTDFVDQQNYNKSDFRDNAEWSFGTGENSKRFVIVSDSEWAKTTAQDIKEKCENETYECNYDFNEDSYCTYIYCDYVYFEITNPRTGAAYYAYMAESYPEHKENCTKEEFEEFKTRFNIVD